MLFYSNTPSRPASVAQLFERSGAVGHGFGQKPTAIKLVHSAPLLTLAIKG